MDGPQGAEKVVTAREANQGFSDLLRRAESGETFVITRHGEPVAKLVPMPGRRRVLTPEQEAALERTRQRVASGVFDGIGWPGREVIYGERIDELERRRRSKDG